MAFHYYVSFKGNKQGQLKGESTKSKTSDKWVEVIAVEMGSEVPVDSKAGKPKGPRTHTPLTITKELDSSSPQLLQALWQNELLSEVVLEKRLNGHAAQRITLTNATITTAGRALGRALGSSHTESNKTNQLEKFGLTFQKIQVENITGGTSATDDWTANNS